MLYVPSDGPPLVQEPPQAVGSDGMDLSPSTRLFATVWVPPFCVKVPTSRLPTIVLVVESVPVLRTYSPARGWGPVFGWMLSNAPKIKLPPTILLVRPESPIVPWVTLP